MSSEKERYIFELLCIETEGNDIRSERAFLQAISFSSRLWPSADPREVQVKNVTLLMDNQSGITLSVKALDTSKMLTDYSESAFIIHVLSESFDELETFRHRLLIHLKKNLKFTHIRLLTDDISTAIANQLYPEINRVESLLRRYLTKFFIQRVGLNFWEATATRLMIEKVRQRSERKDEFGDLVDIDVSLVDFDDLGELIYKQTSGFNQPDKILNRVLEAKSIDDLKVLQSEIQGNYTKYFKEFFQDKHFEPRWRELHKIRNKVAHQGTLYGYELERGLQLTTALTEIIGEAEARIDDVVFSIEEKQAIRQASLDAQDEHKLVSETTSEDNNDDYADNYFRGGLRGLRVVGKIALPEQSRYISEAEILSELEEALDAKYNNYVGLKWFVTTFLHGKSYAVNASYSLINIMADQKKVDIYHVKTSAGYEIKALRLMEESEA